MSNIAWKFTGAYHADAFAHMRKVEELYDALKQKVMERADDLLRSGAINISDFAKDEYVLSKILITAVLEDVKWAYSPLHREHREMVENLKHF